MKFKIGDKVKVNRWVGGIPKDFNGIGTVISINTKSPYPVRVDIGCSVDYGFKEEELELYKEEYKGLTINNDEIVVKGVSSNKWYSLNSEGMKEIKEDKMEKTFKEVIADIKEGEVWVGIEDWNLTIIGTGSEKFEMKFSEEINFYEIDGVSKFKLQRKEYTFEEAFKSYEEGKEIESCDYRYKKIDNIDHFLSNNTKEWKSGFSEFELKEIRGKWYIN